MTGPRIMPGRNGTLVVDLTDRQTYPDLRT